MNKSLENMKERTDKCSSDRLACTTSGCKAAHFIAYIRRLNDNANVDEHKNKTLFSVHVCSGLDCDIFFSDRTLVKKKSMPQAWSLNFLLFSSPPFFSFLKSETAKFHLSLHFTSSWVGAVWCPKTPLFFFFSNTLFSPLFLLRS